MQEAGPDRDGIASSIVRTTLMSYKYALKGLLKGRVIAVIHFIASISHTDVAFDDNAGSTGAQRRFHWANPEFVVWPDCRTHGI